MVLVIWRNDKATAPTAPNQPALPSSNSAVQPAFNKQLHSINDPTSIWVIVNKGRVLPSTFAPELEASLGLQPDAAAAMNELMGAASQAGLNLRIYSGYRSYANQVVTYNGYVKSDGVTKADTYSARPGHSEHQTGLAADLSAASGKCNLQICFGDMAEGQWLGSNAYKYGFIIRYPKDKQSLTGYQYEPWHVRYVGKDLAEQIQQTGQTLEQFFDLPSYNDYPASPYKLQIGS